MDDLLEEGIVNFKMFGFFLYYILLEWEILIF